MRLIIATKNRGKFLEIKHIFGGLKVKLISLNGLKANLKIKEDGKTFFQNALKKAMAVSKIYPNDLVVGEDSGLEVKYLNNRPGIFSKRYAGKNSTDYRNNLKLLRELKGVKKTQRRACYRCVVALVKDSKIMKKFEGKLCGTINDKMVGKNGFGYDPIFYLPKYKKTVAQLPLKEKNRISHRAKAFGKLKKFLASYLKNK
ncbi:MAG: non-canonical purine NTP pyrophosphatase, RdgB/HAM1 family [Candidatus Omnitrophota bacterium]|nr:MAG: non-canonical purine NTP pyrophosphatase, RdgB/HAM1 family [Candidatus Omnitrophota bacterium]HDN86373.1 RdgB/HAM1 family non-canonical purine NTP pyrophosphatase [Candidatus Omnitrophota bacterium]